MARKIISRFRAKRTFDEPLLFVYIGLLAFGLVMIYSASSAIAENSFGSSWHFVRNQVMWCALSIVILAIVARIDLERLALWAVPAVVVMTVLLALVFLMPARNDAHRWLFIGPFSIQPSEFFKVLVVILAAFLLGNAKRTATNWKQLVWPLVPMVTPGIILILLEPNLGMVLVIGMTLLGIIWLSGARWKHLLIATVPLVLVGSIVVFGMGYKDERVLSHIEAIQDPLNGSYQVKQAALTLGAGGLFGVGLGDGSQKHFFLPYPHTDFIFAASGEEIGFVGLAFVLAGFVTLLYRGVRIALRQRDRFGFLMGAGLTWLLFISIAINLGMVVALLPVVGIALPFVSYGGSSMLASSIVVGLLLNLSRREAAK